MAIPRMPPAFSTKFEVGSSFLSRPNPNFASGRKQSPTRLILQTLGIDEQ